MSFIQSISTTSHLLLVETLAAPLGQVNMPSYAGEEKGDPPRFVKWSNQDGTINANLDSIPSQANRIEPIFSKFPDLVPDSKVVYPNVTLGLVDVPHRAADPAIRYFFAKELEALAKGDAQPLAKRNPTALLFGLWDSRATMTKIQRVITASVKVRSAGNQPSATSLSTPFDDATRQQLETLTGKKASEIGIDQVPDYKELGTLDTMTGATIERRVFLSLSLLDKYEPKLRDYLRGLALVALLYPVSLELRSGTSLVRRNRQLEAFNDNELSSHQIGLDDAAEEALVFARAAAKKFGIGEPETLTVDVQTIAASMKEFSEKKAAKKAAKTGKGNR